MCAALLARGRNSSHLNSSGVKQLTPETAAQVLKDVESQKIETVEDQVEFEIKLRLLQTFRMGVLAYMTATILTYLIPIFVVDGLQNGIRVLEFIIQYTFMAALIYLFRCVPLVALIMSAFAYRIWI